VKASEGLIVEGRTNRRRRHAEILKETTAGVR
jgi:hypothetical protein